MKITYVTPETSEELLGHFDTLKFLFCFLPPDAVGDVKKFIDAYAGCCTLVYSGKVPVGCFVLYPVQGVSKKSLEIHGIIRQDLRQLIGRVDAAKLVSYITREVLEKVFETREKLIAKIPQGAKGARVWLVRNGFERVPNKDKGRTIWKLEKRKYLNAG